jgi:hypothetical protein
MHLRVLSQWLEDRVVIRHAARASALARVVRALLTGGKLSLTHLGRSLDGAAKEKHQIKAVDRLLGNQHLHGERDAIYAAIARTLLLGNLRPVVIVDWSDFELGRQWLMLKAAVPVGGRAISIYERVYPFKRYNSPGVAPVPGPGFPPSGPAPKVPAPPKKIDKQKPPPKTDPRRATSARRVWKARP